MQLDETFSVDEDGFLVRDVVPARGTPYRHRCPLETYEDVAHVIDELGDATFTLSVIHERLPDDRCTPVAVALAFLKERGCVRPAAARKHIRASGSVYLDAMTEYHALREGAPGSATGGGV